MRLKFVYKNKTIKDSKVVSLSINETTGAVSYTGEIPQDLTLDSYETIDNPDLGEYVQISLFVIAETRRNSEDELVNADVTFGSQFSFTIKNGAGWQRTLLPDWRVHFYMPFYGDQNGYRYKIGDSEEEVRVGIGTNYAECNITKVYQAEILAHHYSLINIVWKPKVIYDNKEYILSNISGYQATYILYNDTYDIINGANFTMSYNEELSSGTIIIRSESKIDIEPFDEVIIKDTDLGDMYMCIDTYDELETRNKYEEKVYTYQIKVMSQTKLLENYPMPSLSITPRKSGVKLSIYDYLVRYNNLYGPKVRVANGFVNKFSFSSACSYKFDDDCPELQFNNPTLRECFTLLMNVKDCIPVVNNNLISFIDISKKNTFRDKNDEHISYVHTSQSSADYVSDIKMNIKNSISENISSNGLNGHARSYESGVVNGQTMEIYTQHPIYEIISVKVVFMIKIDNLVYGEEPSILTIPEGDSIVGITYDITDLVKEKKEWDVLKIAASTNKTVIPFDQYDKYQNTTLYFVRGTKTITNLGAQSRFFLWYNQDVLSLILRRCMGLYLEEKVGPDASYSANVLYDKGGYKYWQSASFEIEYKTKSDITAIVSKKITPFNERTIIDNQSNNYINPFTQGLLEYAKANRLGNKMKTYNARYDRPIDTSDLPQAGDYFDGNEIIYKVDYQFNENSIDVTMYACPNYVLRNYFTGVQSKLRSWKIVDTDEAFYREDNYKVYCEFSKNEHIEKTNIVLNGNNYWLYRKVLTPFYVYAFGDYNLRYRKDYIDLTPIYLNNENTNPITYLYFESIKTYVGNSIVYTLAFYDNAIFGRYIKENIEGGSLQENYKYIDDNGEMNVFKLSIKISSRDNSFPQQVFSDNKFIPDYDQGEPAYKEACAILNLKPAHNVSAENNVVMLYYKDNKEIPHINYQIEFCSDTDDIVFGSNYINNYHSLDQYGEAVLKIKLYDGNVIDVNNPDNVPSGGTEITTAHRIHINTINANVNISVDDMTNNQTCIIYESEGNKDYAILSFYGTNSIWCNLLYKRNKSIYSKDGNNWIKIGEI